MATPLLKFGQLTFGDRAEAPLSWGPTIPTHGSIRFAKTFATLELQFPSNRLPLCRRGFSRMPADDERDTEHWRRLEAEARTIAASMTNPEARRTLFFIAEGYKLLADRAEFRKTQKD
jgi:hypothetical protein